jgi:hypothetical protein
MSNQTEGIWKETAVEYNGMCQAGMRKTAEKYKKRSDWKDARKVINVSL